MSAKGLRSWLALNYVRWHIVLGLCVPPIVGGIFYASNRGNDVRYIDSLFFAASAFTITGLTSALVAPLTRWQQVILYLLFQCGSLTSVAFVTLAVRRHKFIKRLRQDIKNGENDDGCEDDSISSNKSEATSSLVKPTSWSDKLREPVGRGGFPNPVSLLWGSSISHLHARRHRTPRHDSKPEYMVDGVTAGRNSRFIGVRTQNQRAAIVGLEISAMTVLLCVMGGYWLLMQLICVIVWAPYFHAGAYADTFNAESPDLSRTWYAFFVAGSMLANCGLSPLDSSLTGFTTTYLLLIPGVVLMLGGYLCMPVFLRGILWLVWRFSRPGSGLRRVARFTLDHPRRYETYALLVFTVVAVCFDWVCFFVLDTGNSAVYGLPAGASVMDGLTQAIAIRSSGFYTVMPSNLAPAVQVLNVFMGLFAIYGFALAIRASNVYEERALGLRDDDCHDFRAGLHHLKKQKGYVMVHLSEQLAYDVWAIVVALWLVCIIERDSFQDPARSSYFTIFAVLYEVSSAYANVGFSLGLPYASTSLSAEFRTLSKLLLCVVMVRGRTRGLPIALDRAVMTPSMLDECGDHPERGGKPSKGGQAERATDAQP